MGPSGVEVPEGFPGLPPFGEEPLPGSAEEALFFSGVLQAAFGDGATGLSGRVWQYLQALSKLEALATA